MICLIGLLIVDKCSLAAHNSHQCFWHIFSLPVLLTCYHLSSCFCLLNFKSTNEFDTCVGLKKERNVVGMMPLGSCFAMRNPNQASAWKSHPTGSWGHTSAFQLTFKTCSAQDIIPSPRSSRNMGRRVFGSVTAVFSQRIYGWKHVYELRESAGW